MHYAQLINTRKLAFPSAPPYPPSRLAALTNRSKVVSLGVPPAQLHHRTKSDATFLSDLAAVSEGGGSSVTGGTAVPRMEEITTMEMESMGKETPPIEHVGDQEYASSKEEEEAEEEAESEPLLFSVDEMVHVDEELGMALESDHDAVYARDSHFLAELEDNDGRSTEGGGTHASRQHHRHHSRHLSRNSQSISRLFVGE